MDEFIIISVQTIISIILYLVNKNINSGFWKHKVNKIALYTIVIIAILSTIGSFRINEDINVITKFISTFLFLGLLWLIIQLIFGILLGVKNLKYSDFKKFNFIQHIHSRKIAIFIAFLVVIFGGYYMSFNLKSDLCDCELNFIEGSGVSKQAYVRIQDQNRMLTMSELTAIAATISVGSFNSNLEKVISINSFAYNDCLKTMEDLNGDELGYIKDELLDAKNEAESDSKDFLLTRKQFKIELDEFVSKNIALEDREYYAEYAQLRFLNDDFKYKDEVRGRYIDLHRLNRSILSKYLDIYTSAYFHYDTTEIHKNWENRLNEIPFDHEIVNDILKKNNLRPILEEVF